MATSDVYLELILAEIILGFLRQGEVPTIEEIETELEAWLETNDVNSPQFDASDFTVGTLEESSAAKYNETLLTIKQDLDVLFKTMYRSTNKAVRLFDRWESKADKVENRIGKLEGRIDRLLTLAKDTAGFFDIVGDNFSDTSLVDLDFSSGIAINLAQALVTIAKGSGSAAANTRVFLNDLNSNQAVFNVVSQNSVIGIANQQNTEPRFAFRDQNQYWKTHILATNKVAPMISDLTVSLVEEIAISRITIRLHTSESNSTTKITPLYSTDGINYSKVPALQSTLESLDKMEFVFPEISMLKLKFIIEKNGYDFLDDNRNYVYEFGAKEIGLYKESFSTDASFKAVAISKELSAPKPDGSLVLFNRTTLEVCESVPDNTSIDYFIGVARDSDGTPLWLTTTGFVAATDPSYNPDNRLWTAITPLNRDNSIHPKSLDFSTVSKLEQTNIGISFDKAGGTDHKSPAQSWTILQQDSDGVTYTETADNKNPGPFTIADRRYFIPRKGQRILDLQVDKNANLDLDNIRLWRNVGERGIEVNDSTKMVRGTQIGWEYSEPYYRCVIEIDDTAGLTIDVGDNPITIDQVSHTGVIGPDVLSAGTHKVKIHKDYWRWISPDLNTLEELKTADILYPHNQKLLIEGYQYGSSYPDSDEQVYIGADRFAGLLPDKVGLFDMIHNVTEETYDKFALDTDAPATSTFTSGTDTGSDTPVSSVFLLNVNDGLSDFVNEKFVLEFNLTDELFSYVALRAELRTSSSQSAPVLDEYRIKLAT